jgi:hypothetical protein
MLKKSASVVLSSQESSTGTRPPHHSAARQTWCSLFVAPCAPEGTPPVLAPPAALPAEGRVLARWGWVGEKSGLFEHPARTFSYSAIPTAR